MPLRASARVAVITSLLIAGCYRSHDRARDAAGADGGPVDARTLCARTGGRWLVGPCCPPRCGTPCPLRCVSEACDCGSSGTWDDALGCRIPSPECS